MARLVALSVPAMLLTLAASDWAYSRNCTAQEKGICERASPGDRRFAEASGELGQTPCPLGRAPLHWVSGGRTDVAPGRLSPVP